MNMENSNVSKWLWVGWKMLLLLFTTQVLLPLFKKSNNSRWIHYPNGVFTFLKWRKYFSAHPTLKLISSPPGFHNSLSLNPQKSFIKWVVAGCSQAFPFKLIGRWEKTYNHQFVWHQKSSEQQLIQKYPKTSKLVTGLLVSSNGHHNIDLN